MRIRIYIDEDVPSSLANALIMKLWFSLKYTDMKNRIEFLSSWK